MPQGIYKHKKGVDNHNFGRKHSEKSRRNMSLAHIGKKFTEEHKKKIGKANIGKRKSEEFKKMLSDSRTGKKNIMYGKCEEMHPNWKGDNVGYYGLHVWVRKQLGKPKECKFCGKKGEKNNGRWNIEWANKSKLYLRDKTDWINLCHKCHSNYDKK